MYETSRNESSYARLIFCFVCDIFLFVVAAAALAVASALAHRQEPQHENEADEEDRELEWREDALHEGPSRSVAPTPLLSIDSHDVFAISARTGESVDAVVATVVLTRDPVLADTAATALMVTDGEWADVARDMGVPAAPDLKTMLADPDIQGVILTVPNEQHLPVAREVGAALADEGAVAGNVGQHILLVRVESGGDELGMAAACQSLQRPRVEAGGQRPAGLALAGAFFIASMLDRRSDEKGNKIDMSDNLASANYIELAADIERGAVGAARRLRLSGRACSAPTRRRWRSAAG